jgi:putative transposase
LLEEGPSPCALRTRYRRLAAEGESRERRDQVSRPAYSKPAWLATGPHPLWSWDSTKRPGPVKWSFSSRAVILDLFSRSVTGWLIA